jgi:hypothetical protein
VGTVRFTARAAIAPNKEAEEEAEEDGKAAAVAGVVGAGATATGIADGTKRFQPNAQGM